MKIEVTEADKLAAMEQANKDFPNDPIHFKTSECVIGQAIKRATGKFPLLLGISSLTMEEDGQRVGYNLSKEAEFVTGGGRRSWPEVKVPFTFIMTDRWVKP